MYNQTRKSLIETSDSLQKEALNIVNEIGLRHISAEIEMHYYEGTWVTVLEDGIYKMLEANIIEVYNPVWDWFYE